LVSRRFSSRASDSHWFADTLTGRQAGPGIRRQTVRWSIPSATVAVARSAAPWRRASSRRRPRPGRWAWPGL